MKSSHEELVVVTGGAGFIGSHTVERLLGRGARVVVLDDFSTGRRANLAGFASDPNLTVVDTNIANGIFVPLAGITASFGPVDRIIHLAAQVSVVSSIASPLNDLRLNCAATIHVLEYARVNKVKKVVFSSSAACYGDVNTLPVDEELARWPVSPYGINKLSSEMYLRCYSSVHGLPTTSLRFFNVYGPRQDPSSPYSGVISIFFDRALAGDDVLIFGDGEQTRDFVFVGDVADAVVTAAFSPKGDGDVANIGTGSEVTINELARLVVEATDSASAVKHRAARAGEILRSRAEVARADDIFGFRATVDIATGLRRTAAWFREFAG